MTLKDKIDSLPQDKRNLLQTAFEYEVPQFVVLPGTNGKKFVGVHCEYSSNLKIVESAGVWSSGIIISNYREVG